MKRERRDGLRLASAVAAADAIAFDAVASNRRVQRYLAWASVREDLPSAIAHSDIAEAVIGRCPIPELRLDYAPNLVAWLREWSRNLALLVPIVSRGPLPARAERAVKKPGPRYERDPGS